MSQLLPLLNEVIASCSTCCHLIPSSSRSLGVGFGGANLSAFTPPPVCRAIRGLHRAFTFVVVQKEASSGRKRHRGGGGWLFLTACDAPKLVTIVGRSGRLVASSFPFFGLEMTGKLAEEERRRVGRYRCSEFETIWVGHAGRECGQGREDLPVCSSNARRVGVLCTKPTTPAF